MGIAIVNSNGNVQINNTKFVRNHQLNSTATLAGGGGVYIEFTECAPGFATCSGNNEYNKKSRYVIDQCVFDCNENIYTNTSEPDDLIRNHHITMGAGGGLSIWLFGDAQHNMFYISSNFTNNRANMGGGFSFELRDNSSHNVVDVSKSHFCNNSAKNYQGGGGALVGYIIYQLSGCTMNNSITFTTCHFNHNHAPKGCGGGINWFGSREPDVSKPTNSFKVVDSCFESNEAQLGSALSVTKEYFDFIPGGILLTMIIDGCTFIGNSIQPVGAYNYVPNSATGIGAVATTGINIQFRAHTQFKDNNSSAVIGDGAVIEFYYDSIVKFESNHGLRGGAILLIEGSFMRLYSNVSIRFCENTAILSGGAIYAEMSTPFEYLESHVCFIRYHQEDKGPPSKWNVTLSFINNNSTKYKNNIIFSGTLRPCMKEYNSVNVTFFQESPQFTYEPPFSDHTIATFPSRFNSTNATKHVSPGAVFHLPVKLIDELDHDVTEFVLIAACKNSGPYVHVLSPYQYARGLMQIKGKPTETCLLELKTDSNYQITTTIKVTLSKCQAGYYYDNSSNQCECIKRKLHGTSVLTCDFTNDQLLAYVNPAYWIGFHSNDSNMTLVGPCPSGYCYRRHHQVFSKSTYHSQKHVQLPQNANITELNQTVCGYTNRKNVLCGLCIDGYSVLMNSPMFSCANCSNNEQYRAFIIIPSYIIPVFILFFLFMNSRIRITSVWWSAFLFYAQIVGSEINFAMNHQLNTNSPVAFVFSNVLFSFYSLSNLEPFENMYSYCLFDTAKTIHILTVKLVAALYPLLLIIVYSLLRAYCRSRCGYCEHLMQLHRSINYGLSAFFVLCFAKINVLAFAILTPVEVVQFDTVDRNWRRFGERVVYFQGDMLFFQDKHLPYAIMAIVVIIVIVIIPTAILLLHPLMACLLGKLGLGEGRLMQCIERTLQIHRLKLLLDSFQSDYKPKWKLFAGLHFFLYKTLIFLIIMVTPTQSISDLQLILLVVLVVMLFIHVLIRPFRKTNHNYIYILMYLLLIVQIGILYLNTTGDGHSYTIYLGTILTCIPLLCFLCYICWKIKICVQNRIGNVRYDIIRNDEDVP